MGTVTDYLDERSGPERAALERVIRIARELAPDASEGESYGMPALLHRGKGLVSAMQAKHHLGFYPFSGTVLEGFADELAGFAWSKGTVQFSAEHQLPDELLRRILRARIAEIDARLDRR
ncbi:iron chaperone [Agromyces mediolanus]|uniref:YdhG-like domain-containing protein n=1 Tax=Agromyces mediolanus TaxID=41986 RepID=A0A918CLS5_AGRME|nr:DUF1801 domain-containing protein [Agromyces mediolanus]GGR29682.1 hypothetical protein GCM10010196_24570 [Agromyces mediolanus]GLJ72253.1 hypothetical protein GCM10017583_15090 [Agromyces mediolanus]